MVRSKDEPPAPRKTPPGAGGVPPAGPPLAIPAWRQALYATVTVVLFFAIVEAALWAGGYPTLLSERDPFLGFSERVPVFELDPGRGVFETTKRALAHSFNYQSFRETKPANGFRLFTLGGSSAYGFPWGSKVAFTRLLGDALQASWPGRTVEAVNAAGMSYGSHRLRVLAHEVLSYRPDAVVFYEGHNEFIERRFRDRLSAGAGELGVLRQVIYRSRLGSLMTRAIEKVRGGAGAGGSPADDSGKTTGELLGLDVVREDVSNVGDADRAEVYRLFEDNLRAIVDLAGRGGARAVLCTVPSNLGRWPPNQSFFGREAGAGARRDALRLLEESASLLGKGDAAGAATRLEAARALAPSHAGIHYQLGRAYEALGRWDDARAEYVRARDTDAAPSRAPSAVNEAIRRVAAEKGAVLVDVEAAFAKASPHGVPGFDLFEDYVHPKPEGHRIIAHELWRAFEERGLVGPPRPPDEAVFRRAVGEGGASAAAGTDAPAAATEAKTPALLYNLAVVLEHQNLLDEAAAKYRECLALDPRYLMARSNLGRLLLLEGRAEEAASEFSKALDVAPGDVKSLVGLGESLRRLGRLPDALGALERAVRTGPNSAAAWGSYGGALLQAGRLPDAESAFRRESELQPSSADAWARLGFALLFQRKLDGAQAAFRKGLDAGPDHVPSHNGLAAVLTEKGDFAEAERLFRESLEIAPGDAAAQEGLKALDARRTLNR